MKIALITDQHMGVRNNNILFMDYFQDFYENIFFPELEDRDINTVFNLGDHLDNRKTINVLTSQKFNEMWVEPIIRNGITEHSIIGNHTAYYKNTNRVNSLSHLYHPKNKMYLYETSPKEINVGGIVFGMVPWITSDNREECLEFIKTTRAEVLCGHFEIAGFYMDGGAKCESGISVSDLKRFRRVFSGHFHKKQTVGNISYLGTPYDMTFSDLGETKGFHIFDTETFDLEFIPNPKKKFHRLYYDDVKHDYEFDDPNEFDDFKNCFVRLVVLNKQDFNKFDTLLDMLEQAEVYRLQISETVSDDVINSTNNVDMSLTTIEIINNHIDELQTLADPSGIKDIMGKLHTEAMNR